MALIPAREPVLLGLVLALAGCASAMPPLPPVLTVESRNCAAAPDLTTAKTLVIAANKPVTSKLGEDAGCLQGSDGTKAVYVAFQLPASDTEYLAFVTSDPVGESLFSPHVLVLDSGGQLLRDIPRDTFTFHGASLNVGLRIHPGERYLVVASDPQSIGQRVSQISDNTQSNVIAAGPVFFATHTGSEATVSLTYSYNGSVSVSTKPLPTAK